MSENKEAKFSISTLKDQVSRLEKELDATEQSVKKLIIQELMKLEKQNQFSRN